MNKETSGKITPITSPFEDEEQEQEMWMVNVDASGNEEVTSSSKKRSNPTTLTYLGKRRKTTESIEMQQEHDVNMKPLKAKLKHEAYHDMDTIEYQNETEYVDGEGDGEGELLTELEFAEVADTSNEINNGNKVVKGVEIIVEKVNNDESIDRNTSGAQIALNNDKLTTCRDVVLEANFDKLEQVIGKCVSLAEKCMANSANQDSNEVFGKFIASMVKELPIEKRMRARFEIIQYTGDLIARASNN